MGSKTGIEWTDATWNPIIGCSRVSEGCRNCYAEGIAGRFGNGKKTVYSGLTQIVNGRAVWTGQIAETRQLLQPLSWRSPKRVFVNSMSDLFHENVTDEQRDRIFAVMALCPQHTFQVLTKRPARMLEYLSGSPWGGIVVKAAKLVADYRRIMLADAAANVAFHFNFIPLPNVWLGVSVENQATADERIPLLLQTPAAVRFISAEPLLGAVNLSILPRPEEFHRSPYGWHQWLPKKLHWVICGGESGPHARPMHPDWARSLRDQCAAAGVPFFFKQWGEWAPGSEFWEKNTCAVDESGRIAADALRENFPPGASSADGWEMMHRAGKKAAGALLDGVEHKGFPA
jgi:protein gp37